ncbi:MAG: homoserine kinase [Hyphomicrobiales bacterium]|nr:homoserine kinase [Hyphomicrobiales bacterium]
MAVYTEINDQDVSEFASQYEIGHVIACKGIAEGIENTNYLLVTSAGTFILTLYERRVRGEDLPFFLDLMEYLAHRGIPCPTPVHGRDGAALRSLAGRHAAIVTFLSGLWSRRPQPQHCFALGQAMARLHLAGAAFPARRSNDLSVASWGPLLEAAARHGETVADDLLGEIRDEIRALETLWPNTLPAGVIHADLFPDNVFFDGDQLTGLIDFYFACTDFFAYDLAIVLNAWCFEDDGSFNVTKARRLVRGYTSVRVLTPEEMSTLPILARGAAIRFLVTRLYDWVNTPKNALVTPKNPSEYIQRMRFHRDVRSIAAYGLE